MEPLERAIRSALEKGNAADAGFREKVYRSAFAALERALAAPNIPDSTVVARRASLQDIIAKVEGEHRRRAALAVEPSFPAEHEQPSSPQAAPLQAPLQEAPPLQAEPRDADAVAPFPSMPQAERIEHGDGDGEAGPSVVGERRALRRQRSPLVRLLVPAVLILLAVIGAWWVLGSGSSGDDAGRNGAASPQVSGPASETASRGTNGGTAAPTPLGQARSDPNAVVLFSPEEPGGVATPGDAAAEVVGEGEQAFLRIRSGASGSAVIFNVPQAVLQQLAGRRAVFVVSAQAEEGQPTQMSVSCSFGEMGDCGRQRYDVTIERAEYIFDVDMPEVQPGADGTIAVVSDIGNTGKAVDIYGIRVSVD